MQVRTFTESSTSSWTRTQTKTWFKVQLGMEVMSIVNLPASKKEENCMQEQRRGFHAVLFTILFGSKLFNYFFARRSMIRNGTHKCYGKEIAVH